MSRSPSTIAGYINDFQTFRDEITQSLAADQLVHSLAQLDTPDPDLHQQHINTARELRLQTDTLDKITDRRQRRDRRIQEEEIQDVIRENKAAEELAEVMIETGLWTDPTPFRQLFETEEILSGTPPTPHTPHPNSDAPLPYSDAPRPDAGPRATNSTDTYAKLSPPPTATETSRISPNKTKHQPQMSERTSPTPEQIRSNPNKPDQDHTEFPAKHGKSYSQRRETTKQRRNGPQNPTGPDYPVSWHNPVGYIPRGNENSSIVRQLFGR
jgi:hypothetical protein